MTPETATPKRSIAPRVIAVCTVAVVALGFWGYRRNYPAAPESQHLYRSLQLFVFESGDLEGTVPWQLEVARLAAPVTMVASAAVAFAALTRNRVDRARARTRRGHVVVCGLGERGAFAALALQRAGHTVVGVDVDVHASGGARCRRARIPVVDGDGRDPAVLAAAGVGEAAHLVILTPALGLSGDIALAATTLVGVDPPTPLTIHLEIAEPHLATLFRAIELGDHTRTGWRLEELDLTGVGARTMLDEQPPWASTDAGAHLVVVGASPLGVAVAAEAARRWRRSGGAEGALLITMFDADPTAPRRLPTILHGAKLNWGPTSPELPGAEPALAELASALQPVNVTYVCVTDEVAALGAALAVMSRLPTSPVLVSVNRMIALTELLRGNAPQLHPVSLANCALTARVLLDGTVERVARSLHDSYRQHAPAGDASAVGWDHLPEPLKASNRANAEHIADKIRATDRVLVPDDGDPPNVFTDDEIEFLGRLEHERWVAERLAAGWVSGQRDPAALTTPYLVPWGDLDEEARELDRRLVRAIPEVLTDAGLVLRRTTSATLGFGR